MTTNKNIKTIIFDFDGVIIESVKVKGEAFQDIFHNINPTLKKKIYNHHIQNGGMTRTEKIKIYLEWVTGKEPNTKILKKFVENFGNLVLEKILNVPDVIGCIQFLKKYKSIINFHIVSATPEKELKFILKNRGLNNFFDLTYGSPNTKITNIKMIMEKKKLNIKECLMIGDSINDFKAATACNIKFWGREINENKKIFPKKTFTFNNFRDPKFTDKIQAFYNL